MPVVVEYTPQPRVPLEPYPKPEILIYPSEVKTENPEYGMMRGDTPGSLAWVPLEKEEEGSLGFFCDEEGLGDLEGMFSSVGKGFSKIGKSIQGIKDVKMKNFKKMIKGGLPLMIAGVAGGPFGIAAAIAKTGYGQYAKKKALKKARAAAEKTQRKKEKRAKKVAEKARLAPPPETAIAKLAKSPVAIGGGVFLLYKLLTGGF